MTYGDSNCIDNSHLSKDCWWMLDAIFEFTSASNMPTVFKENAGPAVQAATKLPGRMENSQLHRYSKVIVCSSIFNLALFNCLSVKRLFSGAGE